MNPLFVALRYIYPLSCVFVPCMLYQLVLYRRWDHQGRLAKGNLVWRYVFILYLFLVMHEVGIGTIWDILADGLTIRGDLINLIPFHSDGVMTYLLNIVLFMPLGFLLPLIWGRYRALVPTALTGFLFSLSIELGQLFNHRLTDIDDIMMNSLGTVLGFGLWYLLNKRFRAKPREEGIFPDKPTAYLALTILGTFFLSSWRLTVLFFRL